MSQNGEFSIDIRSKQLGGLPPGLSGSKEHDSLLKEGNKKPSSFMSETVLNIGKDTATAVIAYGSDEVLKKIPLLKVLKPLANKATRVAAVASITSAFRSGLDYCIEKCKSNDVPINKDVLKAEILKYVGKRNAGDIVRRTQGSEHLAAAMGEKEIALLQDLVQDHDFNKELSEKLNETEDNDPDEERVGPNWLNSAELGCSALGNFGEIISPHNPEMGRKLTKSATVLTGGFQAMSEFSNYASTIRELQTKGVSAINYINPTLGMINCVLGLGALISSALFSEDTQSEFSRIIQEDLADMRLEMTRNKDDILYAIGESHKQIMEVLFCVIHEIKDVKRLLHGNFHAIHAKLDIQYQVLQDSQQQSLIAPLKRDLDQVRFSEVIPLDESSYASHVRNLLSWATVQSLSENMIGLSTVPSTPEQRFLSPNIEWQIGYLAVSMGHTPVANPLIWSASVDAYLKLGEFDSYDHLYSHEQRIEIERKMADIGKDILDFVYDLQKNTEFFQSQINTFKETLSQLETEVLSGAPVDEHSPIMHRINDQFYTMRAFVRLGFNLFYETSYMLCKLLEELPPIGVEGGPVFMNLTPGAHILQQLKTVPVGNEEKASYWTQHFFASLYYSADFLLSTIESLQKGLDGKTSVEPYVLVESVYRRLKEHTRLNSYSYTPLLTDSDRRAHVPVIEIDGLEGITDPFLRMRIGFIPLHKDEMHSKDALGRTPLFHARCHARKDLLIESLPYPDDTKQRREYINQQDVYGNTALHHAVIHGNNACLEAIVESGGNCYVYNKDQKTPLMLVKDLNKPELEQLLGTLLEHNPVDYSVLNVKTFWVSDSSGQNQNGCTIKYIPQSGHVFAMQSGNIPKYMLIDIQAEPSYPVDKLPWGWGSIPRLNSAHNVSSLSSDVIIDGVDYNNPRKVQAIDVHTGKVVQTFGASHQFHSILDNGDILASQTSRTLTFEIYDPITSQLKHELKTNNVNPTTVSLLPENRLLIAGQDTTTAPVHATYEIWDMSTYERLILFRDDTPNDHTFREVLELPNKKLLAVTKIGNTEVATIREPETGKILFRLGEDDNKSGYLFKRLHNGYIGSMYGVKNDATKRYFTTWNSETGEIIYQYEKNCQKYTILEDGNILILPDQGESFDIVDPERGELVATHALKEPKSRHPLGLIHVINKNTFAVEYSNSTNHVGFSTYTFGG